MVARHRLLQLYEAAGDFSEAGSVCREILKTEDNPKLKQKLGEWILSERIKPESTSEELVCIKSLADSGNLNARYRLLKLYEAAGNFTEAAQVCREILKTEDDPKLKQKLGEWIFSERIKPESALEALAYVESLGDSGNPDARYRLLKLYETAGNFSEAAQVCREILKTEDDPELKQKLGEWILSDRIKSESASEALAYVKYLADSGNPDARYRLLGLYEAAGNFTEAAVMCREILRTIGDPALRQKLGEWIVSNKIKPENALEAFQYVQAYADSGSGQGEYQLLSTYEKKSDYASACSLCSKILAKGDDTFVKCKLGQWIVMRKIQGVDRKQTITFLQAYYTATGDSRANDMLKMLNPSPWLRIFNR